MGKVVVIEEPGRIGIHSYPEAPLKAGEVRLATLYTGISAGTQLTLYRGRNPFIDRVFNRESHLFGPAPEGHSLYPVQGAWGYEEVGRIVETAPDVTDLQAGMRVYGVWGHRTTQVITAEFARDHLLPESLEDLDGIYSQMGCIALNAVLDAQIRVGETVVVFGMGVPGQLVSQLARLNGARVVAVDLEPSRLQRAQNLGADFCINPLQEDVAAVVRKLTDGRGADVAIEISGSDRALHEAIRTVCYNGRVVCSGFLQGGASNLRLGEEFHHNRIQFTCSQIDGIAPDLSNRWNRLRMEKTIFALATRKQLELGGLVTHRFPFKQAQEAYQLLDQSTEDVLQCVLDCTEEMS